MTALELMQYADGELSPERARQVAAEADSEAGREQLLAMAELGEGVRAHVEAQTSARAPDFEAMWAAVECRIHANGLDHEPETAVETPPAPAPKPRGFFAELGAWLDRYRGHFVTGAVAAGAAAALMVAIGDPPQPAAQDPALAEGPPRFEPGPSLESMMPKPEPMALASQPPEVEQIEVYGGSGMVLTLADEDGGGTAVIWLSGDDDSTESPI